MRILRAIALTVLLVIARDASSANSSSSGKRLLTLDAFLQQKNWGPALIDPTGRWLVFEQTPAYDHMPDYGTESSSPGHQGFGEIMVIDLKASDAPRQLFEPERQTLHRIQSFSPAGGCLALYGVGAGRVSLAVYELSSGRLHTFVATPELNSYETTAVWASDDEIVYTALADGQQPQDAARPYIGNQLYQAWNRSWQGKEPSVTEIASHANGRLSNARAGVLVRASCRTGAAENIAQGYFTDLAVSADGRFVAGLRQVEILQPPADGVVTDDWTRRQLMVVDLKSGRSRVVVPEMYVSPGSLVWSPTAGELGFFAWKTEADSQHGEFYSYDVHSEKRRVWPTDGLDVALGFSYTRPGRKPDRVAWLGRRLAIFARRAPENEKSPSAAHPALAGSEEMIRREGKGDWFLLSPEGRRSNLTSGFTAVSPIPVSVTSKALYLLADGNVVGVSPDGRKTRVPIGVGGMVRANNPLQPQAIALAAHVQGRSSYVFPDLAAGAERAVTIAAPSENARLMDGSARAGAALFREDTDEGSTFILQRAQGAPVQVGRVNEYLAEFAKPEFRTVSYRVRNDRELRSGMFLPYGYEAGRRYPVVVVVYPGTSEGPPVSRIGDSFGFYAPQLIAADGYIVFFASTPLDLERTDEGPVAGMTDLVLAGVDALVAQGYADPDRICLFGLSQGGLPALWLPTQTLRFKASVSINGWADMQTHYLDAGNFHMLYPDTLRPKGMGYYDSVRGSAFGIGRTPWQDPDAYVRNSPVWQAHRIHTPLLLIHSDMDFGLDVGQYERMFNALYRLRKEARFVRYWGEGHGPSSPANIRDLWNRVFAWFDEWADVTRDSDGKMVWEGDRVKSRRGTPGD